MSEVETLIVPGDQDVGLAPEESGIVFRQLDFGSRLVNILVSAKVVIRNNDGDFQNAAVRLRVLQTVPNPDPGFPQEITKEIEIDRADVRIPGGGGVSVSLLGWVTAADPNAPGAVFQGIVTANPTVEILASTFNGVAQKTRIAVTVVDTLT